MEQFIKHHTAFIAKVLFALCDRTRYCTKSMLIQKTGWLLEEKEVMHHSPRNKVPYIPSLPSCCCHLPAYNSWHYNRFEDSDLNIMPASGCWICAATAAWFTKCGQGKYKLQPAWASFGVRLASASQLILLCASSLIICKPPHPTCMYFTALAAVDFVRI